MMRSSKRGLTEIANEIEFVYSRVKAKLRGSVFDRIFEMGCTFMPADAIASIDSDAQDLHQDVNPSSLASLQSQEERALVLLSGIIALEDNTPVYMAAGNFGKVPPSYTVQRANRVVLNKGDVLLFRSDLIHAGAEHVGTNVRLHFFVESEARVFQSARGKNSNFYKVFC